MLVCWFVRLRVCFVASLFVRVFGLGRAFVSLFVCVLICLRARLLMRFVSEQRCSSSCVCVSFYRVCCVDGVRFFVCVDVRSVLVSLRVFSLVYVFGCLFMCLSVRVCWVSR